MSIFMVIQLNDLVTVRLTLSCFEQQHTHREKNRTTKAAAKTENTSQYTHHRPTHTYSKQPPAGFICVVEWHHSIIWNVNSWQNVVFSHLAKFFFSASVSHTRHSCVYGNFFFANNFKQSGCFEKTSQKEWEKYWNIHTHTHYKVTERTKCAQKLMLIACFGCESLKCYAKSGEWECGDVEVVVLWITV